MADIRKTSSSSTDCLSAISVDAAFKKIRKKATGFYIWKVEDMNIIALPREQYGTFLNTECYVIYAASQHGQPCSVDTVEREHKDKGLEYHIHFWLGSEAAPDKSGVAAYKTVELDSYIGSLATEHREAEGNESSRFMSYFTKGIKILRNTTRDNPKLYKVAKRRTPVFVEMSEISWNYFNSTDVFILSTKPIYIWIGRNANETEKLHATRFAIDMREQRKGVDIIFVDDGYEKTLPCSIRDHFNIYLPLKKRMIFPSPFSEIVPQITIKLYKCAENNGKYRVTELKTGPLYQRDLNAASVFIIDDASSSGVWIWVSQQANDKERIEALRNARGFIKKKKYPSKTRVTRVIGGHEPREFTALFSTWRNENTASKATIPVLNFNAATMEERPILAAETQLIDDGSGTLSIWRISMKEITKLPEDLHRYFFSEDCYIALYTYQVSGERQVHLLYYWLGSQASQDEIDLTLLRINELDEDLGKISLQARLIQGRETPHFLQLFKGRLTIFKGKGTKHDDTGKNKRIPSHYLLQVFGSTTYETKAIQVTERTSSLNSNYCFVLKRNKKVFIWCGSHSNGDQREMAKGFGERSFELILEGKEDGNFFELLGGKAPYATETLKHDNDPRLPRLIYLPTNESSTAEEIIFFEQQNLLPEHVMMLDTNECIFLWIGKLCCEEEEKASFRNSLKYLQLDPSGRDMNMAVIYIKQEHEPPVFIGLFPTWDKNFWKTYKSFSKIRQEIEIVTPSVHYNELGKFDQFDKYPVNILRKPNDELPTTVNPLNKEVHLTYDDFVSVFKMTYVEFSKLPHWKQQEVKKKAGLF